ncbi:hypothetical protein E0H80_06735 [Acinetobacter sp. ANC 4779]|uniref:TauD/TfdA dioxygenase family protein n=1 Tax=Acinetobacter sp. ANC 4779 TaxID=2529848 RepID=UPI001039AE95|nr:TauD/TfdA family dioxygenase [Acinetobacter sp. ANC 4779]TCB51056.1 hypothetical protein E0H80_06735 [Acinetobacter sp. ANC 4779]
MFKNKHLNRKKLLSFAVYIKSLTLIYVQIILYWQHNRIRVTPPDVVPVSNAVRQGDYTGHGELSLHADHLWSPQPSFGSLLYAIELPEDGGQTAWFNTLKAYEVLDRDTQKHIDELQLITYNPFVRRQQIHNDTNGYGSSPLYRFKDQPIIGHAYPHPLLRTHPESGRKALGLNARSEVELVNYDAQASSARLSI